MFVRNPLERLVSAYKNKIENKPITWKRSKKDIFFYTNENGDDTNDTLSFGDFAGILTDPTLRIRRFNSHWKQYYKLCHPCVINYDFIGKLETFESDLEYIINRLKLDAFIPFPQSIKKTTNAVAKNYMTLLPEITRERLLKLYQRDDDLFFY